MDKVKITIDGNSGFCFGVVYAIQMAEDELDQNGHLYCLGDIVHNNMEVDRLKATDDRRAGAGTRLAGGPARRGCGQGPSAARRGGDAVALRRGHPAGRL